MKCTDDVKTQEPLNLDLLKIQNKKLHSMSLFGFATLPIEKREELLLPSTSLISLGPTSPG